MEINSVGNIAQQLSAKPAAMQKPKNFASLIQQYVQQTNQESRAAGKAADNLAMGKSANISETLLAIQKANLSFQLMLSVRNKLVDAYKEVMRMPV